MNLSDLALARSLSQRLAQQGRPAAPTQPRPPTTQYISFSAERLLGSIPPPPLPVVEESPPPSLVLPSIPAVTFDAWEPLLVWCLQTSGGEGAFVVDSQGFVIATWGATPPDGYDGLGAELCLVMEQLGRLEAEGKRLRTLCFELSDKWTVGLRVLLDSDREYVLGLVGAAPVFGPQRTAILRTLELSIPFLK